jgi:hypothetical protein
VKRRWRLLSAVAGLAAAVVLVPIGYIEGTCRTPLPGFTADAARQPILPAADRRPEARTFLTYPEWHIVYEAEAFARHLAAGKPPSSFAYGEQIGSFWTSYCAVNRVTRGSTAAGDAKVMIYAIGISYTVELAVKAAYERTIGRLTEWLSGWTSADDRHAAKVQAHYGAFMHETPWYRFSFGRALQGEWHTQEPTLHLRHWERRVALTSEYGVKAGYAYLIDKATGATLGRDAPTLRFVAIASPATIQAIDPRLVPVRTLEGGRVIVEAPRYQQFNDLVGKLATARVPLVEIAGNDDIFVTLLLPDRAAPPATMLLQMPLERPGWRRVGVAVKVPQLGDLLRRTRQLGGTVEHVYDY